MESQWFVLLQVNLTWQIHDSISYRKKKLLPVVCFVFFLFLFETALLFAQKNQNFPLSVEKVDGKIIQMNLVN